MSRFTGPFSSRRRDFIRSMAGLPLRILAEPGKREREWYA